MRPITQNEVFIALAMAAVANDIHLVNASVSDGMKCTYEAVVGDKVIKSWFFFRRSAPFVVLYQTLITELASAAALPASQPEDGEGGGM